MPMSGEMLPGLPDAPSAPWKSLPVYTASTLTYTTPLISRTHAHPPDAQLVE